MIPSCSLLATRGPATSLVDWSDIVGQANTGSISAVNDDRTMPSAGTLNFSYSGDAGLNFEIFKNGVSIGAPASTSVALGDNIHMRGYGSTFTLNEARGGLITVSGLASDVVQVTLLRTGTA